MTVSWWALACLALIGVVASLPAGQEQGTPVVEGVHVVKSPETPEESARSSSSSDDDDKDDVATMVFDRVERYLKSHSLKVDINGKDVLNAVQSAGRSLGETFGVADDTEEGRGKKKKALKMFGPLLLAGLLKTAALLPLALGGIAVLAGKALLIGKIALLLAGIIGLKKLLSHQKTVTYEIVSHPHHVSSHGGHEAFSAIGGGDGGSSYSVSGGGGGGGGGGGSGGGGGHGGWGRSQDAQQLAYNSYVPVKQ